MMLWAAESLPSPWMATETLEEQSQRTANERSTCTLTRAIQKKSVKTPATSSQEKNMSYDGTVTDEKEMPDIDLSATFFDRLHTDEETEDGDTRSPRQKLVHEQMKDEVIKRLKMKVVDEKTAVSMAECFYTKDDVLMRKSKHKIQITNSGTAYIRLWYQRAIVKNYCIWHMIFLSPAI
jgi:hypothetical protein